MDGAIAPPVKATVCGLPVALSVKLRFELFVPPDCGAKSTATVQDAPMASVPPATGHGLAPATTIPKLPASVPVNPMPLTVRAALPAFVNTTACAALTVPAA